MTDERARIVILEGPCGAGKSTLLRAVRDALPHPDLRFVSQAETYGPIVPAEDDGTLDDEGNLRSLLRIVARLRQDLETSTRIAFVDTLHPTQFVRGGALSSTSVARIEAELRELRTLLVVLRVSEPTILARALVARRSTGFHEYSRKFGATEAERARYFFSEQERMLELLRAGSTPFAVLDGEAAPELVLARFLDLIHARP